MKSYLDQFLSHYPLRAQPLGRVEPLGNAGGESGALLWRFEARQGRLVAKQWPVDGPSEQKLSWIHGQQALLRDLRFVPEPVQTMDGRTVVTVRGRLFELQTWMRGSADVGPPPSEPHLEAAFVGLAKIHVGLAGTVRVSNSAAIQERLSEVEGLLAFELDLMKAAVAARADDPHSKQADMWLIAARRDGLSRLAKRLRLYAAVKVRVHPVLRDARPDHFLFEGDELTGVVDFGVMATDTVAIDLARLLTEWGDWRKPVMETKALKAYEAVRPLEAFERDLLDAARDAAIWLGPARWIRWHFVERREFADKRAVERGFFRTFMHWSAHWLEELKSSRPWPRPH